MNRLRDGFVALTLGLIMLSGVGCKNTPAPVKNADGTITNLDGSVTIPAPQAQTVQNGVLNPDGSRTNADGSVTYPANSALAMRERPNGSLSPTISSPAAAGRTAESAPMMGPRNPSTAAESAAPAPVAGVRLSAPAGTSVTVRINQTLAASRNEVGDRFTGVLEESIVSRGETVVARGTEVSGEVVASRGKGRFKGAGDLGIELTAIGRERVQTSEYEQFSKGRGKRTAGFIGGGAGLGALIGGLAGGGKGALIGGLAGAGAGTAVGAYTGSRDVVIPSESVIRFTLRSAISR
jgi:hypothetical protein